LARRQAAAVAGGHLGCAVYAGGDDFLAFVPASSALAAAEEVRLLVGAELTGFGEVPTASAAVVFFHMRSPLQQAIGRARDLVEAAKQARHGKDALAVGVRRRGGERALLIQPWFPAGAGPELGSGADGARTVPGGDAPAQAAGAERAGDAEERPTSAGLLDRLRPRGAGTGLSPRFAATLERDRSELVGLGRSGVRGVEAFGAEMRRVLLRHHGTAEQAQALSVLARNELSGQGRWDPVPAGLVARFLQAECGS
jgi:CRISPR-associated protein Cmr2